MNGNTPAPGERVTFTASRQMDFFSESELTAQTGHEPRQWPRVVLKELVDNALDAAEETGVAPQVSVTVDDTSITIADNGPGIPPATIDGVLDYAKRVSSREAYVAPDRGAQGNALKTLVAMPLVLNLDDGKVGRVTVDARGVRTDIEVRIDALAQEPVISMPRTPSDVKTGTAITVEWPSSAGVILAAAKDRFLQTASDFAWLNPHLALDVDWDTDEAVSQEFAATDPGWPKWTPNAPTSPYWYTPQTLARLVAAYVTHPEHAGISVREFVTQFRGLSGSVKGRDVVTKAGMSRMTLADLADGGLDPEDIARLLDAMREYSKPVRPAQLGVIGREHLAANMEARGVEEGSFEYRKLMGESGGLPWVVEAAFGYREDLGDPCLITGVNWSPALVNPFRQVGRTSLDTLLQQQWADEDCIVFLHLAYPVATYGNRGKSEVNLPAGAVGRDIGAALFGAVESVTKRWAKQRRAEERDDSARLRRNAAMARSQRVTIKDAAFRVMEAAYMAASSDGTLFANARQIMYAARPLVLALTGGKCWKDSAYFTQTLLPDYIAAYGLENEWLVAYDARGHFTEPHAGATVALGTLEVRNYLAASPDDPLAIPHLGMGFPTAGPEHRFSTAVFIEKEGFDQLIAQSGLANEHDAAFLSTKGMSVTAARELIDSLASDGVRVLIAHDFDKAGFTIAGTLTTSGRRFTFENDVHDVIDIGLRLADVEAYDLVSEPWQEKVSAQSVIRTLRRHGATNAEIRFLCERGNDTRTQGRRVELNALTSAQFIDWLRSNLTEHGAGKVIPGSDTLAVQYRRALVRREVNRQIDEASGQTARDAEAAGVPDDIASRVQALLADDPSISWDAAVAQIANGE